MDAMLLDDSKWGMLHLITQPTRALLGDIRGYPQELPSAREFDHLDPNVKRSNIEYHLGELIDAETMEKVTLAKGKRDFPSTFCGLTDEGYNLLKPHGSSTNSLSGKR